MKKIIPVIAIFLFISAVLVAQSGAQMTFEKTEIDFGILVQGADGVRVFKFKNTGTQPLVIKSARSSCGCTVPEWPTEAIQPGQAGTIKIKYDTNRLGTYTKKVFVDTNETIAQHILTIKVNIVEKQFEKNIKPDQKGSKK
jgi:hypothetical protein